MGTPNSILDILKTICAKGVQNNQVTEKIEKINKNTEEKKV